MKYEYKVEERRSPLKTSKKNKRILIEKKISASKDQIEMLLKESEDE